MRKLLIAAVPIFVAVVLAGCGSSSSGSGGASSAGASTAAAAAPAGDAAGVVAEAKKAVAEASHPTGKSADFPMPKTPFDPGRKRALVISCGDTSPSCGDNADIAVKALHTMGWDAPPAFDGAFSAQKWASYVQQAVQQKYDAIILVSIDSHLIKSAVDAALAQGIAISCMMCASGDYRDKGVMDATVSWEHQGELLAQYLIATTGGKAKVGTFVDQAFPQTTQREAGLAAGLKKCPDCSITVKPQVVAESSMPGPPAFKALIAASPKGSLTDVVGYYDGIALPMATTLKSQGRTDIRISGYDASKEGAQAMLTGNPPFGASVGEPYEFSAWAAVDLVGRKANKQPTWDATELPSYTMTKDNASVYKSNYLEPEGDWRGAFTKLWGKG